jgi:monovalent cation/hydrogen antiporter
VPAVGLIVVLFGVAVLLDLLARAINVPRPVLLVIGGGALAFVPHLPPVSLAPSTIFLIFIPPILFWTALNASARDYRREWRSIGILATVPVLLTMAAVATVARAVVPGVTWPAAFALGAIVAPPDAVAATAVLSRLGLPRRIVTILEGESLVNDATALVAYRIAVIAVVTGAFSLRTALLHLPVVAIGGVVIGVVTGVVVAAVRRRLPDSPDLENTISLLTPYLAYMAADHLDTSGILAVVAAGLYLGRVEPSIVSARTRLQAAGLWTVMAFLLESLSFILIGLALPWIAQHVQGENPVTIVEQGALITATVIVVRLIWVFPGAWLARAAGDEQPRWRGILFVGWTGLRGGTSLALALALPLVDDDGTPFPARAVIVVLTFAVILGTLVVQGVTLAPLARLLKLQGQPGSTEESAARIAVVEAGLARLNTLAGDDADEAPIVEHLRNAHHARLKALVHPTTYTGTFRKETFLRLRTAMLDAERAALIRLRDDGTIGDDVLRKVQEDLDLETVLLHPS